MKNSNLVSKRSYNPTSHINSPGGLIHSNSDRDRDSLQINATTPKIDPLINRSVWRTQKECSVCGDALGSGAGQQTKKHYW